MNAKIRDVLTRAAKTAAQAFIGTIVATQVQTGEITASIIGAAVVAGLAAASSVIWNGLVSRP